jgi:hypothetical protein
MTEKVHGSGARAGEGTLWLKGACNWQGHVAVSGVRLADSRCGTDGGPEGGYVYRQLPDFVPLHQHLGWHDLKEWCNSLLCT